MEENENQEQAENETMTSIVQSYQNKIDDLNRRIDDLSAALRIATGSGTCAPRGGSTIDNIKKLIRK